MTPVLWIVIALFLAFGAAVVAALYARRLAPPLEMPLGETMPTAPLQRLVRWSLAVGLLTIASAACTVVWFGPAVYYDDDAIRLSVTGLLLLSLLVLVAPTLVAGVWCSRPDGKLDERDKAILARAPAGQAAAMLVMLAVWMVALQESFRGVGIPTVYLHLMFWSCLLVSLLASHLGVLAGYRWS